MDMNMEKNKGDGNIKAIVPNTEESSKPTGECEIFQLFR
jgi:hypothetical protein